MEPVAYGIMAMIGGATVLAIILGAASGSTTWQTKRGLTLGLPTVVGVYLLAGVALINFSWLGVALFGIAPLVLTFLFSCLTARYLNVRANLRPIWSALIALIVTSIVGGIYILLLRFNLWVALWMGAGLDVLLILFTIRKWNIVLE